MRTLGVQPHLRIRAMGFVNIMYSSFDIRFTRNMTLLWLESAVKLMQNHHLLRYDQSTLSFNPFFELGELQRSISD